MIDGHRPALRQLRKGWLSYTLRALLEARGKSFAVFELVQNAWDANPTKVSIDLQPIPSVPYAMLRVEDDSREGWTDGSKSFTLFGRSSRRGNPIKRGRFCLGEKLVLALCRNARIVTNLETFIFNETGRHHREEHRDQGTLFEGEIRMTREEFAEVKETIVQLIPPVPTTFNGQPLERPAPLKTLTAKLPTMNEDEEGNFRPSMRVTTVEVYDGEPGAILELGIPVFRADGHGGLMSCRRCR